MSKTYITRQGDTFESIAWQQMGASERMWELMAENRKLVDVAVFEAGVELSIPETVTEPTFSSTVMTPPWRR